VYICLSYGLTDIQVAYFSIIYTFLKQVKILTSMIKAVFLPNRNNIPSKKLVSKIITLEELLHMFPLSWKLNANKSCAMQVSTYNFFTDNGVVEYLSLSRQLNMSLTIDRFIYSDNFTIFNLSMPN
jgi:hypothetical protein